MDYGKTQSRRGVLAEIRRLVVRMSETTARSQSSMAMAPESSSVAERVATAA